MSSTTITMSHQRQVLLTRFESQAIPNDRIANCIILFLEVGNFAVSFRGKLIEKSIFLQICDFIQMLMQPFFAWLPFLGLLYVLVPYYNQVRKNSNEIKYRFK